MAQGGSRTPRDEAGVTGQVDDSVQVDWPRSIGFFGALGAAVALELVPLSIAAFVAAVPFLKLLNRPNATRPQRFFSHLVDGAAKPVGGDAEGTIRWAPRRSAAQRRGASRSASRPKGRSTRRTSRRRAA